MELVTIAGNSGEAFFAARHVRLNPTSPGGTPSTRKYRFDAISRDKNLQQHREKKGRDRRQQRPHHRLKSWTKRKRKKTITCWLLYGNRQELRPPPHPPPHVAAPPPHKVFTLTLYPFFLPLCSVFPFIKPYQQLISSMIQFSPGIPFNTMLYDTNPVFIFSNRSIVHRSILSKLTIHPEHKFHLSPFFPTLNFFFFPFLLVIFVFG